MPSRTQVEDVLKNYYAALRSLDLKAAVKTFAPDAVQHCPVGDPPRVGQDAIREFFQGVLNHFDAIAVKEEFFYCLENEAAAKWTCDGTAVNGRHISFEGIDLFRINDDGKITEIKAYWDPMKMLAAFAE
ncbi:MAG: nuclear transport factor 2 family protein [Candidatus Hydrogenedentota bacterium]